MLSDDTNKHKRILQLNRIVCICKGIPLKKVLPAVECCQSIAEVNRMAKTGRGGCQGRRCGPRIKALLAKMKKINDQNSC